MSKQEYLDLLEASGINTLRSYNGASSKRDSLAYGVILSKRDIRLNPDTGKDHSLTCYIGDPSLERGTCSLMVFSRNIKTLEAFQKNCIVRLKNFHLVQFNSTPQLTLNAFSWYAVHEPKTLKEVQLEKMAFPSADVDMRIVKALDAWNSEVGASNIVLAENKRPLLETCELFDNPSRFFDYVGQIVTITHTNVCTMLTLTDFTENPYPPSIPVDQNTLDPKYLINCSVWDELKNECLDLEIGTYVSIQNCVKKIKAQLEFNVRGNFNEKRKRLVSPLEPEDSRLKKLISRRDKFQKENRQSVEQSFEKKRRSTEQHRDKEIKRSRDRHEPYPLRTEFIFKRRGALKSFRQIKSSSLDEICEIKASVSSYYPENIEDWMQSFCSRCKLYSPLEMPCRRCLSPTYISYRFVFTLKDENNEELKVHSKDLLFPQVSAQAAYKDKDQLEKLKRIVRLATDPDENVFFDFCIGSVAGISQFMNTRFILAENDEE